MTITGRELRDTIQNEGIEDFESEDFLTVLRYLLSEAEWVFGTILADVHLENALRVLEGEKLDDANH